MSSDTTAKGTDNSPVKSVAAFEDRDDSPARGQIRYFDELLGNPFKVVFREAQKSPVDGVLLQVHEGTRKRKHQS